MARERSAPLPALAGSVALHGAVLLAALFAWPWLNPPIKPPQVVPVTLVTTDDQGSLKNAVAAPTPAPAAAETPTPDALAQAPAPQPAPAPIKTPAPPLPTPPKPAPHPAAPPTPAPAKPVHAKPTPSPPPSAKAAPAKPDKTLDLDALAASLTAQPKAAGAQRSSAQRGPNRAQTAVKAQTATGTGSVDSSGALASMAAELQRLWNPDCEVAGGGNLNITVSYRLGRSGRLLGPAVSSAEEASDPVVKAASDRAVRAVYQAEPFENLPPGLYDGQKITVNFDAKKACAPQ